MIEDCSGILTDWTLCMQCKGYYKPADKQVCHCFEEKTAQKTEDVKLLAAYKSPLTHIHHCSVL